MSDVLQQLDQRFRAAITRAFGDEHRDTDPLIRPSNNPQFGDYQANVAMSLAKQVSKKPRDVAEAIVGVLAVDDLCAKTEIAGPGFINLHLADAFIARQLREGVSLAASSPQTVVVDYSSPNVAKEMHVGHLRSTVIGDAIARVLEKQGHQVIRQNHLGDWGTQFGMLIEHLLESVGEPDLSTKSFKIGDLNAFYQAAKKKFDSDDEFAARARQRVVSLQSGDKETYDLWRLLYVKSLEHFDRIYERLSIRLDDDCVKGESFYNDLLPGVIEGLQSAGLLKESQGAKVVFPEGFTDRDDEPLPMIVQKSDGGFLYATTDLAAARFRMDELGAQRVVYVTDSRQAQHFAMVFKTLRDAGWAGESVRLEYVPFGTILGPDRKPFKTRSGGTVKLVDLLDEAEERAGNIIAEKNPDLPEEERAHIAHVVGMGALKYADLSSDRIKDYIFDWDRMLAMDGNTAPYLQNAYVRIRSIFRKAAAQGVNTAVDRSAIAFAEPAERTLAAKVLQFGGAVDGVADSLEPHRLCTYLYELASTFHQFYEKCPVLTAESDALRDSRLALSEITAQTLREGLDLLGIEVVEQM